MNLVRMLNDVVDYDILETLPVNLLCTLRRKWSTFLEN